MVHAVVLAGGSGTRLWPQSRSHRPKHLLALLEPDTTMLERTVRRVLPVVDDNHVYVVTNQRHAADVRQQLAFLHPDQVLAEPAGRNSAAAIGYGALHTLHRDPDATMIVCPADHVILKEDRFREVLRDAVAAAEGGNIVTLGITPGYPDTGYGYMELGGRLRTVGTSDVHGVLRFTEKPSLEVAREYLASGRYVWNSGMFVWQARTILTEIERYMPRLHSALEELRPVIGSPEEAAVLARVWPDLDDISIDYGVLERSTRVTCIPADIGWSDVGDWSTLSEFLPRDTDGNAIVGDVIALDTHNCLVQSSGRLVTLVGVSDLIVVDSGDAVLVCPKDRAQEVKHVVERLRAASRHDWL